MRAGYETTHSTPPKSCGIFPLCLDLNHILFPVTLICSRFNTLKRPFRAIFRKKDRTYYFWLTVTYEAGKQQWSLVSLLSIGY